MTDSALHALAEEAGISVEWRDVRGETHTVAPETLRRVLAALGIDADRPEEARAGLRADAGRLPPLLTCPVGPDGVAIPGAVPGHRFRLHMQDGLLVEGRMETGWGGEARLPAQREPGYHRLELDGGHTTIAVAPARCFTLADAAAAQGGRRGGEDGRHGARSWGLAAQLYALRRRGDGGIGDLTGLAQLARAAARRGAEAVAMSPLHAPFAADTGKYGPYAPSTRLWLNALHADPEAALGDLPAFGDPALEAAPLVDWQAAAAAKYARLRRLFDAHIDHPDFVTFRSLAGATLEDHARFEALHAHFYGADPARWHWRSWPDGFGAPDAPGVVRFARDHAREIAFHAFCQWLADASLQAAQKAAREAGMAVGLIADLAVGTDGGGSHAWSRQREILPGLSVGAPPDIFSPLGQDWGLTAFSPREMRLGGFTAFVELLRAGFRHAGGIRVDHAMGLARLWVVPQGGTARDGAYLRFPLEDLLRLLSLESHRHRAIVIGEDLGTVPEGFNERIARAGILGMRVLWFERRRDDSFTPPAEWTPEAVAMTTTHDLPTAAGWWEGRDIGWRERLGLFGEDHAVAERERATRAEDRQGLWRAFLESGTVTTDAPPAGNGAPVAAAAIAHTGAAACALALIPVEDVLALPEQPNLPGTLDEHPNWRRRLPGEAATLLDPPEVGVRLEGLVEARRRVG
ncbi:4-alpha-glucanotransferase [Roseomonas sp. NAR14]|uniref:4-alpha-glucanotransferase n=1 Tax=Roseomonas acroporae TaxID=2937791 RepID=A0A9X1Y8I7_9PROT|nr:4-alpha-glucanotransferase [Roseomonas acroporae]MCK8784052.1 4-alpha-glucanotransferase [Roseomonas acroporae]